MGDGRGKGLGTGAESGEGGREEFNTEGTEVGHGGARRRGDGESERREEE